MGQENHHSDDQDSTGHANLTSLLVMHLLLFELAVETSGGSICLPLIRSSLLCPGIL